MALTIANRIKETATCTGASNPYALAGAQVGFLAFSAKVANAGTCTYCAVGSVTGAWEVGTGTYATSGNTLARTTVESSSNSDSAVVWTAETINIQLDISAAVVRALTQSPVGIVIDGAGGVPSTGSKGYRVMPYACNITGWEIIGDVSGSAVVDVKKCTYAAFPTTASIAASDLPTLSGAQINKNDNASTWTTAILAGDILEFVVNSATTLTRITVFIKVSL